MREWIINLATHHSYLVYIIILAVAFLEGPIISLATGFLTYTGYLNIEVSILILILGDTVPDSILYYMGRYGHGKEFIHKHFLRFEFISKNVKLIEHMWNHHPWKTIFLGKMAYGMSVPVIITIGLSKVSFKNFFSHSIVISVFSSITVFLIGYNLGYSYFIAEKYIKYVGIFFLVLVVAFILFYSLLSKYFMKQFIIEEKTEEELAKNN